MSDSLAEFAAHFPGWTRPDGMPLSWRHFVVGLRHLGRAYARESLRMSAAHLMGSGFARKADVQAWTRRMTLSAGW